MKRIIWHWSAGTYKATDTDRKHYHFIVESSGVVVEGVHRPEANEVIRGDNYAAHTLNANTGAIGVAVAAMAGAVERPFDAGRYPITAKQVDALVALTARLCRTYGIPVTRKTVLSHAEVQPTLGIRQRGKWDIAWLPGMTGTSDPVAVGDKLRARVMAEMGAPAARVNRTHEASPTAPKVTPGVIGLAFAAIGATLAAFWDKLFGG